MKSIQIKYATVIGFTILIVFSALYIRCAKSSFEESILMEKGIRKKASVVRKIKTEAKEADVPYAIEVSLYAPQITTSGAVTDWQYFIIPISEKAFLDYQVHDSVLVTFLEENPSIMRVSEDLE